MSNSTAKSISFSLPLQSARRRIDSKNEFIRDEKNDLVKALPRMIGKLCIDEGAKQNVADKLIREATAREEITKHSLKKMTSLYDMDEISSEELQTFLCRTTENTQQPFSFLANISKEFANDNRSSISATKPTEIDIQLAALAKRIESNKVLLEEAKSHAKDIHLRAKQDCTRLSSETHDDISISAKNVKSDNTMKNELIGRSNINI